MDKIFIPCDFSDQANNAFRLAVDMAHVSNAEIHLLHVIELPMMHEDVLTPMPSFDETLLKELNERAEEKFSELKKENAREHIRIKTKIEFGPIVSVILEYLREEEASLVVMGAKGVTGLAEVLIGSTAEKIVRHAACPVIVVKHYSQLDSLKNIVLPNSMENGQEDLMMHVKALQFLLKAKLHLVWIDTSHGGNDNTVVKNKLEEFARRYMLNDYSVNVFKAKNKEIGVIDFTHEIGADMIAMGTHARKGLSHFFKGSVTEDVVNHVDCPIWTYVIKGNR
jgi:nucleotide-binding universal stress UspA family protein